MRNWNTLSRLTPGIRRYPFRRLFRTLVFPVLFLSVFSLSAQDRTALEKKREKLLDDIRYTERMLSKTKKDVKATAADISTLKHKIGLREALVSNLEAEVASVGRALRSNESSIKDLTAQLEKLKENYAGSVYNSYKYQKTNQQLVFILGAESVNQAARRLNYLRKLNQRRKEQGDEISATAKEVKKKIAELEVMKQEKTALLAENKIQMQSLAEERSTKDKYIGRLKKDEGKFRDEIKRKEAETKKIDKEIRLIIEREIAAREAAAREAAAKGDGLIRTPEAIIQLSKDFTSNKGKLPWPVEKGYVTRYFGKQQHPELSNIQIDNNGIDIRTGKEAPVRAVFTGEVVSVFSNPMFKNAVIVKHGEYFTVYTKLGSVKVKQGEQLKTRQIIGYAFTDEDVAEVHLEVWKGKTNLDPYAWIVRK
ncbi:MAG: peptidoglycan DD-metalloendopeptidase family protein [Bacteroidetes bacterium]|nr:peptidoglycan DD-metalloendopeptidase family protein [Bacteroidota bacterium]